MTKCHFICILPSLLSGFVVMNIAQAQCNPPVPCNPSNQNCTAAHQTLDLCHTGYYKYAAMGCATFQNGNCGTSAAAHC